MTILNSLYRTVPFIVHSTLDLPTFLGQPLLSIVPFEGVHGTQLHYEPTNIEYCEPRFDEIDEISIQLLFDTGERIKFTGGKVYVTLHIKDKYA